MADIPLQVISENATSERRITPSWSISQLRTKLEPITGIPPSSQRISLKTGNKEAIPIEAADEDSTLLSGFPLTAYAELHVSQTLCMCHCLTRCARLSCRKNMSICMAVAVTVMTNDIEAAPPCMNIESSFAELPFLLLFRFLSLLYFFIFFPKEQ